MSTTPSDPTTAAPRMPALGEPRRTHPLTIGLELLTALGVVIVSLATTSLPGQGFSMFELTALVVLGGRIVGWWFRTYTVTDRHLELDEGVFNRRHRVVPYSRIQQIDLHQKLLEQLLGLSSLRIETAGEGGATAVNLRLLSKADADTMRRFVLDRRRRDGRAATGSEAMPGGHGVDVPRPAQLLSMSPGDLVLAATTQSFWLLVASVGMVAALWAAAVTRPVVLLAGLVMTVSVLAGIVGLRVVSRLLSDWNWTLTEVGDDLHIRAGLLETREQTLPRRRIQHIAVVDNPLRRAFGVSGLILHTAVAATSTEGVSTTVEVPVIRRRDLDAVLGQLMSPGWVPPPLQDRSVRARRRAIRRRVLLLAILVVAPAVVWQPIAAPAFLALSLPGIPWGRLAHRRAGWAATPDLVAFASGVLHHRVDLVPRHRIQSARVSASPFQRQAGLATIHVDIAGTTWIGPLTRSPRLYDVDAAIAAQLLHELPRPSAIR